MENRKYFVLLAVITAVVGLVSLIVRPYAPNVITMWWLPLLVAVALLNALVIVIVSNASRKDPKKQGTTYLGATMVRMLVFIIALFVFAVNNAAQAKPFMITFIIYYTIYAVFETIALVKRNKHVKH